MPQAHPDAQVLLHALAEDESSGVVDLVGEGVGGVQSLERDRSGDIGKERRAHARNLQGDEADGRLRA
jgi:hypothetical protein